MIRRLTYSVDCEKFIEVVNVILLSKADFYDFNFETNMIPLLKSTYFVCTKNKLIGANFEKLLWILSVLKDFWS